jgi:MarR family transcriptional regulator, organic hydroperoxide resistance regulator
VVTNSAGASTPDRLIGVVTALHQATHVTLHVLAVRLAGLGLTASEQNVLAVLADGRTRPVGELAQDTGTRPTTLTSVLDRLERRHYLTRKLDPADRRSFLVELSASGRRAAATVQAAVAELELAVRSHVSPAELAGFLAVTRALTRAAEQKGRP